MPLAERSCSPVTCESCRSPVQVLGGCESPEPNLSVTRDVRGQLPGRTTVASFSHPPPGSFPQEDLPIPDSTHQDA